MVASLTKNGLFFITRGYYLVSLYLKKMYLFTLKGASLLAQLVKKSSCDAGDLGLIPGLERSPGSGKDYLLQYSGLECSMDCIVHGVAKSWT